MRSKQEVQHEASHSTDPNPSVRQSWRRLATQRRIEPSEFPSGTRFLALSDVDRLTTATSEAVETVSKIVSQIISLLLNVYCKYVKIHDDDVL